MAMHCVYPSNINYINYAGLQHPVQLHPVHAGPALGRAVGGQPGSPACPGGPGRGPLRAGPGEGPHHRVPGGAQAQGKHEVPDPVPVRPSRGGKDLPRQVCRPGARTEIGPDFPGRHA